MRIGIAGDWHCNTTFALSQLRLFAEHGIDRILHLGDFGFWAGGDGASYLSEVEYSASSFDITLFITLGNHEDYDLIPRLVTEQDDEGFLVTTTDHIRIAPRPHRWTWDGVSFLSVGGANSIDRRFRTEGDDWWHQEQITDVEVQSAIRGGHSDVMVAHDAPLGIPLDTADGWDMAARSYARESGRQLRKVVNAVNPDILFHGHFHTFFDRTSELVDDDGEVFELRAVGLADDSAGKQNAAVLDTEKMSYKLLD